MSETRKSSVRVVICKQCRGKRNAILYPEHLELGSVKLYCPQCSSGLEDPVLFEITDRVVHAPSYEEYLATEAKARMAKKIEEARRSEIFYQRLERIGLPLFAVFLITAIVILSCCL